MITLTVTLALAVLKTMTLYLLILSLDSIDPQDVYKIFKKIQTHSKVNNFIPSAILIFQPETKKQTW